MSRGNIRMPEAACIVAFDVEAGEGCIVWPFATIGAQVRLGARCVIGSCCYVGHHSVLGDDVHLNHGTFLPNRSRVGHRVFFGPGVICTDDKHPRANHPDYDAEPPVIEDDVSIGAGAVILPGLRLGQGCTVGAGAVVTHDIPPGEVWVGLPASRLRRWPAPPADGGWMRREVLEPLVGPPERWYMDADGQEHWEVTANILGVEPAMKAKPKAKQPTQGKPKKGR
jgi:UDP-2-acetamido-3-amino-2,3-dideoxy-glucuronate N-acetyltransferase